MAKTKQPSDGTKKRSVFRGAGISKAKHSLNPNREKKDGQRDRATVKRLLMYKNFKAKRDKSGRIVKAAPFQDRLSSGTTARVEPNRKWFGNTRVIGQEALQTFQEHLGNALKDPYRVVMNQTKLPITLLNEKAKNARVHLLDTESFKYTFGPKAQRKRPNLKIPDLESLAESAETKADSYKMESDRDLVDQEQLDSGVRDEARDSIYQKGQSKRIWGELYKVLDSSDVVIEVLDARDPMGTRCRRVEQYLRKEKSHKHLILLLNKVDLIPTWVTQKWIAILSAEYPTVAFHASINNSFGKASLINLLRQFGKLHKDRQQVSIGFIGYPNVGKSSVINTLRRKKVCNVAPIAGETKVWQYVTLMRKIFLIDCPGVAYPVGDTDTQLILKGVVRVENVKDPADHVDAVIERVRREYLQRTYQLSPTDDWSNGEEFLTKIAMRSGRLLKGGEPDLHTVAKMVLNDFQRGRLPFFVKPPGLEDKREAQLVPTETATSIAVEQDLSEIAVTADYIGDDLKPLEPTASPDTNDNDEVAMEKSTVSTEEPSEAGEDEEDAESTCSGLSDISGLSDVQVKFDIPESSDEEETKPKGRSRKRKSGSKTLGETRGRGKRGGERNKKKQKLNAEPGTASTSKQDNKSRQRGGKKTGDRYLDLMNVEQKPRWVKDKDKRKKKPKHQI
jgi:nuclear GTP-binding protein